MLKARAKRVLFAVVRRRSISCPARKSPTIAGPACRLSELGITLASGASESMWRTGTPGRATRRRLGPSNLSTDRVPHPQIDLPRPPGPAGRFSLFPTRLQTERWSRHTFGIRPGLRFTISHYSRRAHGVPCPETKETKTSALVRHHNCSSIVPDGPHVWSRCSLSLPNLPYYAG